MAVFGALFVGAFAMHREVVCLENSQPIKSSG